MNALGPLSVKPSSGAAIVNLVHPCSPPVPSVVPPTASKQPQSAKVIIFIALINNLIQFHLLSQIGTPVLPQPQSVSAVASRSTHSSAANYLSVVFIQLFFWARLKLIPKILISE
jgi:hypothetical protein